MWVAIVGYSTYWGVLLYMALEAKSLGRLDEIMTATLAAFGAAIAFQSVRLFSQIKLVMEPHGQFDKIKALLRAFLVAFSAAILFQAVMVPLTSTNHTPAHEKNGSTGWDTILVFQCIADVLMTILIFAMPYVFFKVDQAAIECITVSEDSEEGLVAANRQSSKVSTQNEMQ